jgi:hypothetical protein
MLHLVSILFPAGIIGFGYEPLTILMNKLVLIFVD